MTRSSTVRKSRQIPPLTNVYNPKLVSKPLRVKQIEYAEVKKLDSAVLVDLWSARFGHEWVANKDVQADDLYCAVAQRLLNEYVLEKQTIANVAGSSYRLRGE